MSLISLQDASFDYGRKKILHRIQATILPGMKIGLVGDNGAGKSTLLAALAGELPLPSAVRQVAGGVGVRVLHQETVLDWDREPHTALRDCVASLAFARELELQAELEAVARALADADAADQEQLALHQGQLQAEFERRGGYTLQSRLETALGGVGLAEYLWDRPLSVLSGGERRRAALAAILLSGGEVLLLDEPTNHLDLASCEWLESFLSQFPGAAVLISHDRQFLDRVTGQIWHLQDGSLFSHRGNYSDFARAHQQRLRQQRASYARQQEYIRRTEDFIQRNLAGQKTRQAQSRRRSLAKEVRQARPPTDPAAYRLNLQAERVSGSSVLQVEDLTKGFAGRILLRDLELLLARGERLGIIGPNGCGKSTLLKMLAGLEPPDAGIVRRGHNVDLGYYDQHLRTVADQNTVLAEMAAVDPGATVGELRGFLGAFGFGADLVDRQVAELSGGERGRLALLRLIKEGHNTLLLDEPTNHLDVRSREALEEALQEFVGTLVVVSHDRRFLDKIVDRLLVFTPERGEGSVQLFAGNYAAYHRQQEPPRSQPPPGRRSAAVSAPDRSGPEARKLSKNELVRRRAWIAEAEQDIAGLEIEKQEVLAAISNPESDAQARQHFAIRHRELEEALARKMALWEKWNLEIEESQHDDPSPESVP